MSDEIRAAAGLNIPAIREAAAAFREKQEAATEGPWWRIDPPWGEGDTVHAGNSDDPHGARAYICTSVPLEDECLEQSNVADDMAFIAHARNTTLAADVERLCDEIERLRKLVNENGETR